MPERIDKTYQREPWVIESLTETHKDKQSGGGEQGAGKDAFTDLQDKTDWQLLLDKDITWKRNLQLNRQDIDKVLFHKLNLKSDPSLLRTEIHLKSGEQISPAYFPIPRIKGLKMKAFQLGEMVLLDDIFVDDILRVTVPKRPEPQPGPPDPRVADPRVVSPQPVENQEGIEKTPLLGDEDTEIAPRRLADFWTTLSVRDHLTRQIRPEIAIAYICGLLFLIIFIWGLTVVIN